MTQEMSSEPDSKKIKRMKIDKKENDSKGVNNAPSTSQENNPSGSRIPHCISLRNELLDDFIETFGFGSESPGITQGKTKNLLLNDDEKRKKNGNFIINYSEFSREIKRLYNEKDIEYTTSNVCLNYKPGPKSRTKDFNYEKQDLFATSGVPNTKKLDLPIPPILKVVCFKLGYHDSRVVLSWDMASSLWATNVKMFELYICREYEHQRERLVWSTIGSVRPREYPARCVLDLECGYTYHFNIRSVDILDRRSPFAYMQRVI